MAKKSLSAKQKSALAKGQSLMKKAKAYQKASGTKTRTIKAGGKTQTIEVFKMNMNRALRSVSGGKKLF